MINYSLIVLSVWDDFVLIDFCESDRNDEKLKEIPEQHNINSEPFRTIILENCLEYCYCYDVLLA